MTSNDPSDPNRRDQTDKLAERPARSDAGSPAPATTASPDAAGAQTQPAARHSGNTLGGADGRADKLAAEARGAARILSRESGQGSYAYPEAGRSAGFTRRAQGQGRDGASALTRLGRFVRNRPAVVVGGALISGFLLVRFLQRSSRRAGMHDDYRPTGFARDRFGSSPATGTASTSGSSLSHRRQSTGIGLYPGDRPVYDSE